MAGDQNSSQFSGLSSDCIIGAVAAAEPPAGVFFEPSDVFAGAALAVLPSRPERNEPFTTFVVVAPADVRNVSVVFESARASWFNAWLAAVVSSNIAAFC